MRKVLVLFVTITMIITLPFSIQAEVMSPTIIIQETTIFVNTTGSGGAYTSIQGAIDNASDGDTIYVFNGTYIENIWINKSGINLTGESKYSTIIDAQGISDAITVYHIDDGEWVNITGFSIRNATSDRGIYVWSDYCSFYENQLYDNHVGIWLYPTSRYSTVYNNTVFNSTSNGIGGAVVGSKIYGNTVYNCSTIGINLQSYSPDDDDCEAYDNTVFSCTYGMVVGSGMKTSTIRNNYIHNCSYYGMELNEFNNNEVYGNIIENNTNYGITMTNVRSDSYYWSYDNKIYGNVIDNHTVGIHSRKNPASDSYNNEIFGNIIKSTDYAFQLNHTNNSYYHHNNILNSVNGVQLTDCYNFWNDSFGEGNYWDDYLGADDGSGGRPSGDGVGDTLLPHQGVDYYPLMTQYVDTGGPSIYGLQPEDLSKVNTSKPTISAALMDISGVDVNSVVIELDGSNVTSSATITSNSVSYTPVTDLTETTHTVFIQASENTEQHLTSYKWWNFTVGVPPILSNPLPPNGTVEGNSTPEIRIDYNDLGAGIDSASGYISVDGIDVTSIAVFNPFSMLYVPSTPLSEGNHTVYIEISDNAVSVNTAIIEWNFSINTDSMPPMVTNLTPANSTPTASLQPIIGAQYSDDSGISISKVKLVVDGIDITSNATVTYDSVYYTPTTPLIEGNHDIYLEVVDTSPEENKAVVSWNFTVDSGTIPELCLSCNNTNAIIPAFIIGILLIALLYRKKAL